MKIHCIGIGGIGVSALAQYYLSEGHEVSGSDLRASEITTFLEKKGVNFYLGNNASNIKEGVDLLVYSPAVPKDNPELLEAQKHGITTKTYPEALGELTRRYKTIAVAGSHGKSTTTAMLALALIKANFDPSVIVGTKLKEFGNSNFHKGNSQWLLIEACEYDGSFLQYDPEMVVLTNIDKEHLDYFKTFENVKKAFRDFVKKVKEGGFLVVNADDPNMPNAEKGVSLASYSLAQKEVKELERILQVPGKHNIANGLAVLEAGRLLGIKDEAIFSALESFKGTWRRFETSMKGGITIISDYGHHPTEVEATLQAAREKYPEKTIWCVFQPHQYQRTQELFADFVRVMGEAPVDHMIVTDIYDVAGRETQLAHDAVSAEKLVTAIKKSHVVYVASSSLKSYVTSHMKEDEVLIVMGAGDIYQLAEQF